MDELFLNVNKRSNQWNASERSTVFQGLVHLYFQSWIARDSTIIQLHFDEGNGFIVALFVPIYTGTEVLSCCLHCWVCYWHGTSVCDSDVTSCWILCKYRSGSL